MSIHFEGKKVREMYWAGRKVKEAWYGGERVFSGKPVEVMPALSGAYDAQDWLRAKLTEYGEDYRTVEELPFEIDSSQVTNMSSMFDGCSSLTTVPDMNTHNVTNVSYMFYGCSSLTDGNVRLIGKRTGVNTYDMITQSGLTREPFYDASGRPI